MAPGPSELIYLDKAECEFSCGVQEMVAMQARFYNALSTANVRK